MGRGLWEPVWSRRQTAWGVFLLTALAFGLYAETLRNEFFNWDDPSYVVDNLLIRHWNWTSVRSMFSHFYSTMYIPLVWVSFLVDYHFWPLLFPIESLDPLGYHLQNVLWFTATVPLLFFLMRRLSSNAGLAWISTAFFVVHPVHVESVAWITERKDVLFGFFFFSSLLAYLRYRQEGDYRCLGLSFFLFGMSCLSKTTAVMLPLVLLAVDLTLRAQGWRRKLWLEKIPFFALSLLIGISTSGAVANFTRIDIPFSGRVRLAGLSSLFYVAKSFWPVKLSIHYPMPLSVPDFLWGRVGFGWELLIGFLIAGCVLKLGLQSGKNRMLIFLGGIFWFPILPVLQWIPVHLHLATDRFLYVGSLGVCGAVAMSLWQLETYRPRLALIVLSGGLVALSGLTWTRENTWKDSVTIWEDAVKKYPQAEWTHYYLGMSYLNQQDEVRAEASWKQAVQFETVSTDVHVGLAHLYWQQGRQEEAARELNLGKRGLHLFAQEIYMVMAKPYEKEGRLAEAVQCYRAILDVLPNDLDAHENLGRLAILLHQPEKAREHFLAVTHLQPASPNSWTNLGKANLLLGRRSEAIAAFQQTLYYQPDHPTALAHMAELLLADGHPQEVETLLRRGLALNPNDAHLHYTLGTFFLNEQRVLEAIPHLQQAVRFSRKEGFPYANLGAAYATVGETEKAIATYQHGLRIAPQHAGLWANLAVALQTQNRREEALSAWKMAVQFDPNNSGFQNQLKALQTAVPSPE